MITRSRHQQSEPRTEQPAKPLASKANSNIPSYMGPTTRSKALQRDKQVAPKVEPKSRKTSIPSYNTKSSSVKTNHAPPAKLITDPKKKENLRELSKKKSVTFAASPIRDDYFSDPDYPSDDEEFPVKITKFRKPSHAPLVSLKPALKQTNSQPSIIARTGIVGHAQIKKRKVPVLSMNLMDEEFTNDSITDILESDRTEDLDQRTNLKLNVEASSKGNFNSLGILDRRLTQNKLIQPTDVSMRRNTTFLTGTNNADMRMKVGSVSDSILT
ncbi:hypothetical protein HK096_011564 [Nowakowskiella sp. JEL0078]|nr:hypothetical protein HK096_011564 [Nowakowskiella sp. JEL0078]